MILTDTDVKELIKNPYNKENIAKACRLTTDSLVHFTGKNFKNLITQLIKFEDAQEYAAKRGLAEPVTMEQTTFIYQELTRWQNNPDVVRSIDFKKDDAGKKRFEDILTKIWKGSSISYYANRVISKCLFTNFNDFILIEKPASIINDPNYVIVEGIKKLKSISPEHYIIHIPISSVKDFRKSGDQVEYLIFSYNKKSLDGTRYYRVLDDTSDRIYSVKGTEITQDVSESVIPLQTIPVLHIGSEFEEAACTDVCISPINHVIPLMNRYIKFDAMNLISETKTVYPKEWYLGRTCPTCQGSGEVTTRGGLGEDSSQICPECSGNRFVVPFKLGEAIVIPPSIPDGQTPINSVPGGSIAYDVTAVTYQKERLKDRKKEIIDSALGYQSLTIDSIQKSATEAKLNVSPLEDRNAEIARQVARVENWICNYVGKEVSPNDFASYNVTYPNKLNILDEITVTDQIKEAKLNGLSFTHILQLNKDLLYAKYRNDTKELRKQLALLELEPYAGYTVGELTTLYGVTQENKILKSNFNYFVNEFQNKNKTPINEIFYEQGYNKAHELLTVLVKDEIAAQKLTNETL